MERFKRFVLLLHRWLGFISGLAVFIVSITGCIFTFQDEIQDMLYPYRSVEAKAMPMLMPSRLQALTLARYPGAKVTMVVFYGAQRPAQVRIVENKTAKSVFFNPYSGAFLHTEVLKDNFFLLIKEIHVHLFLPAKLGKLVNGITTLIFLVIMVSGLILWWPKRKSDRKRALRIKWKGKWKRLNYDLHNVLGFYITCFALIFALSALSFSFQWLRNGLAKGVNLGRVYPGEKQTFHSDSTLKANYPDSAKAIDKALATARKYSPQCGSFLIYTGSKPGSPISISAYPIPLHFSFSSNYAFDRYSGRLLGFVPYHSKSPGAKLTAMNYDIHTGQIAGTLGKIIAFFTCLVSASLPLTGLMLYLHKKRKTAKPAAISAPL
jgi:uncharacterized iron-regulated membrane protein